MNRWSCLALLTSLVLATSPASAQNCHVLDGCKLQFNKMQPSVPAEGGSFVASVDFFSHDTDCHELLTQEKVDAITAACYPWLTVTLLGDFQALFSFARNDGPPRTVDGMPPATQEAFLPDNRRGLDFDGDGRDDLAVLRGATMEWSILYSGGGALTRAFGPAKSIPVPGDYDGDGRADLATYDRVTGSWQVLSSASNTVSTTVWGWSVAWPVPSHYDYDGKFDKAVYNPLDGTYYWLSTYTGEGDKTYTSGGLPCVADLNGNRLIDPFTYLPRGGIWTMGYFGILDPVFRFGRGKLYLVPDNYTTTRAADLAYYTPPTSVWTLRPINQSKAAIRKIAFGDPSGVAVPGDYDGDGLADLATYHAPTGRWRIRESGRNGAERQVTWGGPDAEPVALPYWLHRLATANRTTVHAPR